MRILLAEDDEVLADGLSRALRETGYAVDVVNDGQQADAALSTQECDLLILDLGLPKMSGLEVLRRARASHVHAGTDFDRCRFGGTTRSGFGFGGGRLYGQAVFPARIARARAGAHAPPSGFWPKPNSVGQFEL